MKFDRYDIFARLLPALVTAVPYYVIHFFVLSPLLGDFWGSLLNLKLISDITMSLALWYLSSQINRIASKELIEKRMYRDGLEFPTTNYLLHLDRYYSGQYTQQIHSKIKHDFGISIPSKKEEKQYEDKSRKIISEAISRIRYKVGKGALLHQHNIEYGMIRNFAGGSIIASVISAINIGIFSSIIRNSLALNISIIIFWIYFLISIFSKKMITSVGKSYARVLIQEYMSAN